jgi:hypothetical protein
MHSARDGAAHGGIQAICSIVLTKLQVSERVFVSEWNKKRVTEFLTT